MHYLDFLSQVHDLVKPRSYLEIGVRNGHSMALSSTRSIGIDPAYAIAEDVQLGEGVTLYQETSDDFFDRGDLSALEQPLVDLSFIDGLHLYEFVLRDFMNVEKHVAPGAVVIFDDVMPRNPTEAARDRQTRAWTGDVWKIIPTLRAVRPDLILLLVGTAPTGLLLVLGTDPASTGLADAYDRLLADHVASQDEPPEELLRRTTAIPPEKVLAAPFWSVLRDLRDRDVAPAQATPELLASLQAWAATALSNRQAKAVHPSLTGRPKAAAKSATGAAAKKAAPPAPPSGGAARLEYEARRVARGVRRRVKRLLDR